jgi:hypothetical protein
VLLFHTNTKHYRNSFTLQVVVGDETIFDQMIADAWNCEDGSDMVSEQQQNQQQEDQHNHPRGRSRGNGQQQQQQLQQGSLSDMLVLAGLNMEVSGGGGKGKGGGAKRRGSSVPPSASEPYLVATDWWLEHLRLRAMQVIEIRAIPHYVHPSRPPAEHFSTTGQTLLGYWPNLPCCQGAPVVRNRCDMAPHPHAQDATAASPAAAPPRADYDGVTLKWLYGKITCQIADEFSARQRELVGTGRLPSWSCTRT